MHASKASFVDRRKVFFCSARDLHAHTARDSFFLQQCSLTGFKYVPYHRDKKNDNIFHDIIITIFHLEKKAPYSSSSFSEQARTL